MITLNHFRRLSLTFIVMLWPVGAAFAADTPICPVESVMQVASPPVNYGAYNAIYSYRLPVMAPFWDTNGDGYKEFFSVEGYTVALRNGQTGAKILEHTYPAGALVTSLGSLGASVTGSASADYYIGYAFPGGGQRMYGLDVYNGDNHERAFRFPEFIDDVTDKARRCDNRPVPPLYPFPVNTTGFSAVALADNKIAIGAPNANMAVIFEPADVLRWAREWHEDCDWGGCEYICPRRDPYQLLKPDPSNSTVANFGAGTIAIRTGATVDQLIISAPTTTYYGNALAGMVFFFKPKGTVPVAETIDFDTAYTSRGLPNNYFGSTIANLGDLNDDGSQDFAMAAPGSADNDYWGGTIFVAHGPNITEGKRLFGRSNTYDSEFSYAMAGNVDLDEDGNTDIAISGPGHGGRGVVRVLNPATGEDKLAIHGYIQGQRFGQSVVITARSRVVIGDITGRRYFALLGKDLMPEKEPDKVPDRCDGRSTVPLTPELQAISDEVKPLVKQSQGALKTLLASFTPWNISGMARLRGLKTRLFKVATIITNNQPAILGIGNKLDAVFATALKSEMTLYYSAVTACKNSCNANKKKNIKNRWRTLSKRVSILAGYFGSAGG